MLGIPVAVLSSSSHMIDPFDFVAMIYLSISFAPIREHRHVKIPRVLIWCRVHPVRSRVHDVQSSARDRTVRRRCGSLLPSILLHCMHVMANRLFATFTPVLGDLTKPLNAFP